MKIGKSPYNMLQEIYKGEEYGMWKVFVCNMMLNLTGRKQVDQVRDELFRKWPAPKLMARADQDEVKEVIKLLGLSSKRSKSIIKMSQEFITKKWVNPKELHGLGQYAQDSYEIFFKDAIIFPQDKMLRKYIDWKLAQLKNKNN